MQLLPLLPVTNEADIKFALFDDGILAILLLIEADLVFKREHVLGREVVSYLLIRLAVVSLVHFTMSTWTILAFSVSIFPFVAKSDRTSTH